MGETFRQGFLREAEQIAREDAILRNGKLTPVDRIILVVLERKYPQVREQRILVQIWKIGKETGVDRMSIHRFFIAMHERGYMTYVVSRVIDRDLLGNPSYRSECTVEELEPMKHPDCLDTRDTPKRKEHRKKCKERLRCKHCGSENILVKVTAICRDCGQEVFQ
jgi:ribosomal protein S14